MANGVTQPKVSTGVTLTPGTPGGPPLPGAPTAPTTRPGGGFTFGPTFAAGGQQAGGFFGGSGAVGGFMPVGPIGGVRTSPLPPTHPAATQQQLLGPFGQILANPQSMFAFNTGQIPFLEANLNFQNLLQAQADRQNAINLLGQQRDVIGASPEQQQLLAVARRRLAQPEPFTPEEVSQQQSAIRQRGAIGLEAAQRQQAEALARQGVRGGATAFQEAGQRQQASRQVSDELQRLAIENALGRDVNEAQALAQLQGITGQDELRQVALNQAISELLTAQRGEFDLSGLFLPQAKKPKEGFLSKIIGDIF